jgi:hypothetical protein
VKSQSVIARSASRDEAIPTEPARGPEIASRSLSSGRPRGRTRGLAMTGRRQQFNLIQIRPELVLRRIHMVQLYCTRHARPCAGHPRKPTEFVPRLGDGRDKPAAVRFRSPGNSSGVGDRFLTNPRLSWPDLIRPSTSSRSREKRVDHRVEPGDDGPWVERFLDVTTDFGEPDSRGTSPTMTVGVNLACASEHQLLARRPQIVATTLSATGTPLQVRLFRVESHVSTWASDPKRASGPCHRVSESGGRWPSAQPALTAQMAPEAEI